MLFVTVFIIRVLSIGVNTYIEINVFSFLALGFRSLEPAMILPEQPVVLDGVKPNWLGFYLSRRELCSYLQVVRQLSVTLLHIFLYSSGLPLVVFIKIHSCVISSDNSQS